MMMINDDGGDGYDDYDDYDDDDDDGDGDDDDGDGEEDNVVIIAILAKAMSLPIFRALCPIFICF